MTEKLPSHDVVKPMSGKEVFQFVGGLLHLVVNTFGAWWAMFFKHPGTVGTRAYWLDVLCCWLLLQFFATSPGISDYEHSLFTVMWIALVFAYVGHTISTFASKKHVHTKCVGGPACRPVFEFGWMIALPVVFYLLDFNYIAAFIAISGVCSKLRDSFIKERDRQRSVQLADALFEQNYYSRLFKERK